jgi:hypothetical protein
MKLLKTLKSFSIAIAPAAGNSPGPRMPLTSLSTRKISAGWAAKHPLADFTGRSLIFCHFIMQQVRFIFALADKEWHGICYPGVNTGSGAINKTDA